MFLILIRGLPGSGKSTLAQSLGKITKCVHLEADMFFVKKGVYKFNPKQLYFAHTWCQNKTAQNLAAGKDVVVSNTFTTYKEMAPYAVLAHIHKARFNVIEAKGKWKNIHGAPASVIKNMKANWEE